MRRFVVLLLAVLTAGISATTANADSPSERLASAVDSILAQPYQPDYVPLGYDSAFGTANVLNTAPAQDYTTGSIPGSPDAPAWPPWFTQVQITSRDGAPLFAELALHPGGHPGIVVVHGFNTHGYASVIRWAAMLYANGYNVIAADQRDFNFEWAADSSYPSKWPQTFGWKESEDVLAAGQFLKQQPGVTTVGVVGFSEGAQNTILALALDAASASPVFGAGLTFSAPADQDTQIYSTAVPPGCQTPFCKYPATDALVQLVVPPYLTPDVCAVLDDAAGVYGTTGFDILAHETAFHAQQNVTVPLLNFYAADDSLVPAFEATMMAAYESGNSLQETLELSRGEHAYFFDRWWQQRAILLYFKTVLPSAPNDLAIQTNATVNQTPGGLPASAQLADLGSPTRAEADAMLAPYICDTAQGAPGASG